METEAVTLNPYVKMLLDAAVPLVATAIGTVLTVVLAKVNSWMRSKVHSATFDCASTKLDRLVEDAVREANRTIVHEFREAAADGKLTKEEGARIRDAVVAVVKRHLGEKGMAELQGCLGGLDVETIEGLIRTRIESTLDRFGEAALLVAAPVEVTADDDDPVGAEETGKFAPTSLSPDGPARP